MAYANGRIPAGALRRINGGYLLGGDAAHAFWAMNAEAKRRFGVAIAVIDGYRILGSPGDYGRGRWSQWAAWERYKRGGNQAAYPGTSNHGWGLAVDLGSPRARAIIDRIGAKYGFSKSWSDAPGEWWHIRYRPGVWKPAPKRLPLLRPGTRGPNIRKLQALLRKRGYKRVKVTGRFDRATVRAVKAFQRKHKLRADGVVGAKTWARLLRK